MKSYIVSKKKLPKYTYCLDNSVTKNFFKFLKQEMYNGNKFYSFYELKHTILNIITNREQR